MTGPRGIFDERCTVTPVTNEPEAQIARLKYGLSQGLKEGLVPHPKLWPGIQSATALSNGSMKLKGKWVRSVVKDAHYLVGGTALLLTLDPDLFGMAQWTLRVLVLIDCVLLVSLGKTLGDVFSRTQTGSAKIKENQ